MSTPKGAKDKGNCHGTKTSQFVIKNYYTCVLTVHILRYYIKKQFLTRGGIVFHYYWMSQEGMV